MRHVDEPHTGRIARSCEACGAVVSLPAERIADQCPWCGSRLVDASAAAHIDAVCPFVVSERAATTRLREHVADAFWAPRELRQLARSGQLRPKALRGVLVPYYAFDGVTQSRWQARIGIDWWRTEVVRDEQGRARKQRVRETEWHELRGTAVGEFVAQLQCGSTALHEHEVAGLGRFDLGTAVAFDPRVLAGFAAELPALRADEVAHAAMTAARAAATRRIEAEVLPGDHPSLTSIATEVRFAPPKLALVPVWIASYRHRGRTHRLLVHGQCGRCVGRPPIDRGKVTIAAMTIAVVVVAWMWLAGVWS